MIVKVKLMSDLRKYLRGRGEPICCELTENATVADVVRAVGIAPDEEMIVGINGQLGNQSSKLSDGDEVVLTTPMSGGIARQYHI